jgi:hypothetical protein
VTRRFITPLVLAVMLIAGCGGSSQIYSADEVVAAFARSGLTLSENSLPERDGEFITENGGPFYVFVGSESEADVRWSNDEVERLARRANVVVLVLADASSRDRKRAVAALESLPESESPVEFAPD